MVRVQSGPPPASSSVTPQIPLTVPQGPPRQQQQQQQPPPPSETPPSLTAATVNSSQNVEQEWRRFLQGRSKPDMNSDELVKRLRNALLDNKELQETLGQTNYTLERQIQIISGWKSKAILKEQRDQDNLLRLNGLVAELKKENQELKNAKNDKNKETKENKKKEKELTKKEKEEKKAAEKAAEKAAKDAAASNKTTNQQQQQQQQTQLAAQVLPDNSKHLIDKIELSEAKARDAESQLKDSNSQREVLERDLIGLKADNDMLRSSNDTLLAEKWDLSAANTDLQNRLQQSMAMTYMQGGNDEILKEQLHKMQIALGEERKVTEKLSRNLELEKRRVESLEQKAKGTQRKSAGSSVCSSSGLPDEMRMRDEQLASSMERYRIHCERLGSSLDECEKKLESFEIQEDYHVADLRKELSSIRKLLKDERKKSTEESHKLDDSQLLFAQVYSEYQNLRELLKQEKKHQQQKMSGADIEVLSAKLAEAEGHLREERVKAKVLEEKLKQMELDIEAIPILKAQVELYRDDFNAEREARQKIAGEKVDLEEQVRKIKLRQNQLNTDVDTALGGATAGEPVPMLLSSVRNRANEIDDRAFRGHLNREEDFACPKCQSQFQSVELLQVHVNTCLDRP